MEVIDGGGGQDKAKGGTPGGPDTKEDVKDEAQKDVFTLNGSPQGGAKDLADVETFEDLLELAGTSGRWNITVIVLAAFSGFVSPFLLISYQFLGATPDHWCRVAPLVEANWTQEQVLSFAIPVSDNKTEKRSSCQMYDFNYTLAAQLGYQESVNNVQLFSGGEAGVLDCPARDFNRTQYESTVVTQWDLVCERRPLYSTTQSITQLGKLFGSFFFGYMIEALGRRRSVLISGMLTLFFSFLSAFSPTLPIYIFMKGLIAAVGSGYYMACLILSLEISSPKQRSVIGGLFVMPWALGYMIMPGVAYLVRSWQWLQLALTVPALFLFTYFCMFPESPRWLVGRGRYQDALDILTWAARVNRKTLPPDDAILAAMHRIREQNSSLDTEDETQDTCGKRTLSTVKWLLSMFLLPQLRRISLPVFFCWSASSMVYYGVALSATNLSADPYMYIFLGGLLEVPAYILVWIISAYVGRKKGLVLLYLICALSIFLVMVLQVAFPQAPVWLKVLFSQSGKMAITAAFALIWFYTIELFPTKYRSLGTGQASMFARVGSFSSPYINDILGELLVWAPSALFGSVSLVAACLCLLLPETRNKDMPENIDYFNKKSKTKPTDDMKMDHKGQINPTFVKRE